MAELDAKLNSGGETSWEAVYGLPSPLDLCQEYHLALFAKTDSQIMATHDWEIDSDYTNYEVLASPVC